MDWNDDVRGLYTTAMLAQFAQVPVTLIRRWQRRGLLTPTREVHRLAYFDFQQLATARRLAQLVADGISPGRLEKKLAELARLAPTAKESVNELSLVVEGNNLLLRQGDGLLESSGQFRFDFEAAERSEVYGDEPETLSVAEFLASPGADSPEELWRRAQLCDDEGRLDEAVELYRTILMTTGPRAEVCFRLAEVLYRQNDLPAARERYFATIELDEDFVEARANLGCLLAEMGRTDLAVAAFEGALRFHPDYADVHYHLARTLDDLGREPEAAEHWRRFLQLSPDSPWADEARERLDD